MESFVYDCKSEVDSLVNSLRSNGASDREIISAMAEKIEEMKYAHWGRDDW